MSCASYGAYGVAMSAGKDMACQLGRDASAEAPLTALHRERAPPPTGSVPEARVAAWNGGCAGRLLPLLTQALLRHPRWFWYSHPLLVLVCLALAVNTLQFSTDRNDLVSKQDSHRRRFLEFRRDFAVKDNLFVVVESASRQKMREFVERLADRLEHDDQFTNVQYRVRLEQMGPKALLFLSEDRLAGLRELLRTQRPLLQVFSQATNLETFLAALTGQIHLLRQAGSAEPAADTWGRGLPILQHVVDGARDAIESRGPPLAPHVTTLLADAQASASPDLYTTLDQGRIHVLMVQPADLRHEQGAILRLRECIELTRPEVPGVNVAITGEAVLRADEMKYAGRDTEMAALISLVLTALLFVIGCRAIRGPLVATLCVLIGIAYTLGFATVTAGRLNLLSMTVVPIVIGLAIDYGVHLFFRYEEELRRGRDRLHAMRQALEFTGVGITTSALTIAGAFYFMVFTGFQGMREMGLIAGTGIVLCLLPMFTLLPLLLPRGKAGALGPRETGRPPRSGGDRGPHHGRSPWLVLTGAAVLTALLVVPGLKVQFDHNLLNLQSPELPAVRLQRKLIAAGVPSVLYCAVVADSLPQAVQWEARIRQLVSVGRVSSLASFLSENQVRKLALVGEIKHELHGLVLPERDLSLASLPDLTRRLGMLHSYLDCALDAVESGASAPARGDTLRAFRDSVSRLWALTRTGEPATACRLTMYQQGLFEGWQETLELLQQQDDRARLQPEDVPVVLRDVYLSRSGKYLLQVYPKEDVWRRETQEQCIRELRTVDPQVTGTPVQFLENTARLKRNVETAAGYTAGIIALLVYARFRRVSSVLLVLLPVALGFCWTVGLMGWLKIPFNPLNIVSLILLIGIGVTNGVHILNRFAEEPQPDLMAKSTGKAVLISGFNTMVGFGSLMVAQHHGIASLGLVMALGTGLCLVASLALLPALLDLLGRAGWRPTLNPTPA